MKIILPKANKPNIGLKWVAMGLLFGLSIAWKAPEQRNYRTSEKAACAAQLLEQLQAESCSQKARELGFLDKIQLETSECAVLVAKQNSYAAANFIGDLESRNDKVTVIDFNKQCSMKSISVGHPIGSLHSIMGLIFILTESKELFLIDQQQQLYVFTLRGTAGELLKIQSVESSTSENKPAVKIVGYSGLHDYTYNLTSSDFAKVQKQNQLNKIQRAPVNL